MTNIPLTEEHKQHIKQPVSAYEYDIKNLLKSVNLLETETENTNFVKQLMIHSLCVASECARWLKEGETGPITRYGYAMEKLTSAMYDYKALEHNDKIPMEVE